MTENGEIAIAIFMTILMSAVLSLIILTMAGVI